jgi:hypothetical protein
MTKHRRSQRPRRKKDLRFGEGRRALAAMESGELLRREFIGGRTRWSLSGGTKISPFVARRLLLNPEIVALKDGLLSGSSQAFVYLARADRI